MSKNEWDCGEHIAEALKDEISDNYGGWLGFHDIKEEDIDVFLRAGIEAVNKKYSMEWLKAEHKEDDDD